MATTSIGASGVTFPDGTTQATRATGTVTSVATGNGLQGGTITSSGTLSVACPGFNTVGSYVCGTTTGNVSPTIASGGTIAAGSGSQQLQSLYSGGCGYAVSNNLSGTWRNMSGPFTYGGTTAIWCRVS